MCKINGVKLTEMRKKAGMSQKTQFLIMRQEEQTQLT